MGSAAKIDIDALAHLLEDKADLHIVPLFRNLKAEEIETKDHANDFVTRADRETEEALTKALPDFIPGCLVIGEEAVSLKTVTTAGLKDPTLIIVVLDPVDGTTNFKNGSVTFGSMMALVINGEVVAGWIYDVIGEKHYIAVKGEGAWMLPKNYTGSYKSGVRLQVAVPKNLDADNARGFIQPYGFQGAAREFMKGVVSNKFESIHCSAHEYINVACGTADFTINMHMKPWDHLAGSLLVKEAGGVIEKFDGSPYLPTDETGGILVASSKDVMQQVRQRFIQPALTLMTPQP